MGKFTVQLVGERCALVLEAGAMAMHPSGALLFTQRPGYPSSDTLRIGPAAYLWVRAYRDSADDCPEPTP